MFLDLKRLIIGELNHVWLRLEEGLVDLYLGIGVNRVVGDVEVLDDLGFGELINNASTGLLVFDKLAWDLQEMIR